MICERCGASMWDMRKPGYPAGCDRPTCNRLEWAYYQGYGPNWQKFADFFRRQGGEARYQEEGQKYVDAYYKDTK